MPIREPRDRRPSGTGKTRFVEAIAHKTIDAGMLTIMPKTLATTSVDRLLHQAHVTVTEGNSLRLSAAVAGWG